MRLMYLLSLLLSVGLLLSDGCTSESLAPTLPQDEGLIANTSFEINSEPSMQGWIVDSYSPLVHFSTDTPVEGGSHSIRLTDNYMAYGWIHHPISPLIGTHRYQLSAWAKAVPDFYGRASGEMAIVLRRGGVNTLRKSYRFADSTWTKASLLDTVTTDATDTLLVQLHGTIGHFQSGYVLFDLCELVKLN